MNKILCILILALLQVASALANPYDLKVELTPNGAGSLNTNGGSYEEGSSITLRAYTNTGYVFLGWYEGETQLSTSTSFKYTMPAYDVLVIAKYDFDPVVPADPDSMATKYTVTLESKPEGGGSFNTRNATYGEGDSTRFYAYSNTGYEFLHWENEKGEVISSLQNFYYVMPHGNSKIYAVFDFNPEPPANPSKNFWNATTGEVIVDDFTPGRLSNTISSTIGDDSRDQVTMITVAGIMTDNDFGIANNFPNCTLIDLSRVTGITEIPSYAFDYTNLESVYLPATIEKIGSRAFYGCSNLTSLTIYAQIPPVLERNVFTNVPEGLVIYVPAASIGRYIEAEGWKDCTILPLQEDVHSITILLPEGTNVSEFANMKLQLTNVDNEQAISYTTTDKRSYTFDGIPVHTRWTVTLSNQRGDEFSRIENVIVHDEDVTISFTSLKKVSNVSLNVITPDGVNVTDNATISWYSREGTFLAEGSQLNSVPYGEELLYSIKLSGDLHYQYQEQQRVKVVAGTQPSVTLQPIPMVTVTGSVKSEYGILSGAEVALTQWANGQYSRTATTKTAQDGTFTFTAIDDSSRLVVSSPRFRDVVIQRARFGADTDLGTLTMNRVTGIVVVADTRTQAIGSETTFPTVTGSVGYSLYNKTTGHEVEDFVVQGRSIIIPSEAKAGDNMKLTITELSGNFLPGSCDFVIAENDTAKVQLIIQELGGIETTFMQSANAENEAFLYNSEGVLQSHVFYSGRKASFSHLTAGTYTLVAIGKSLRRGNIPRISDFNLIGLQDGRDYLCVQVNVKDKETVKHSFGTIPLFDDRLFNYTSDDSYVQVNKLSVSTGQFVTLSTRVYFKEEYDSSIDDIKLIVDLPDNCQMVDNSLIVGNTISPYIQEGNHLIVPLSHEQRAERVRFCVIPTIGGTYQLSASAQFKYEGEHTQPIGSAYFQTSSLAISVPSSTCQKSVLVSGKAPRQASVEVFDNGTLVAQTEALKNGEWKVICPLTDVYNLSEHRMSAKIHEGSGLILQTESKTVTYDREAVEPLDVTMTFYNAWMKKNISVFYNLKAGVASPSSYSFYHATPITFVANLSNNDPSAVNSVYIHVYTSDEGVTSLKASYDTNLNRWVAVQEFAPGYLPVSVSVSVDYNSSLAFDQEYADLQTNNLLNDLQQSNTQKSQLEEYYAELEDELAKESSNRDNVRILIERIVSLENEMVGLSDVQPDQEFTNSVDAATTFEELMEIIDGLSVAEVGNMGLFSMEKFEIPSFNLSDGTKTPIIKFINVCDSSDSNDLDRRYAEFFSKFFADDLSTIKFTIGDGGTVNCEKLTGEKLIVDFTGIIELPTENTSNQAYLDNIVNYIDHINEEVDIFQELAMKRVAEQLVEVARYHYALSAIPNIEWHSNARSFQKIRMAISVSALWKFGKEIWKSDLRKIGSILWEQGSEIPELINAEEDSNEWLETIDDISKACMGKDPNPNRRDELEKMRKQYLEEAKLLIICRKVIANASAITAFIPGLSLESGLLGLCNFGMKHFLIPKQRDYSKRKRQEMRKKAEEECCPGRKCLTPPPPPPPKPIPPVQPILDPSGYVYEGVASNRLEGVTATVFYKAQTEDMYGDIQETVEKWNAEDYGQVNPQITDSEGKYAWDVPQGQWQVKFEKEGYETAYSEWLPVPPPQLEVNIAMRQCVQPTVKAAHAYEDAVEVEFDKYMMPDELNTYNIQVLQGDVPVEGSLRLLNEEASYENSGVSFASKVRFNATKSFTAQEVTLMVSNRVKSYAGIRMQDDFSQTIKVEREIKQMLCDSVTVIGYGDKETITVSVLPALASKGKKLTVKTSSPMILGVETEQVVIGNDGTAKITVSGELPGTAALNFSVEGTDKTAITIANVEQKVYTIVATPIANIASGTVVDIGTQITFTCETDGVTIYYTLDGSCPCNNSASRIVYDGTPIIINEGVTIKVIAVASNGTESDVAEYFYTTKDEVDAIIKVPATITNTKDTYDISGRKVGRKTKGVIIQRSDGGSRKVLIK